MALTIGGIVLLIGFVFLIYYGLTLGVRKSSAPGAEKLVKCTLCQQRFDRTTLIQKQVGDSKLLYFCESCVRSLYGELLKTGN